MNLMTVALILFALFLFSLARAFRRTLGTAANPVPVMEKPPLPKGLSETVLQIEKWKTEGRVTREEYEKLMHLCREDAEAVSEKGRPSTSSGRTGQV